MCGRVDVSMYGCWTYGVWIWIRAAYVASSIHPWSGGGQGTRRTRTRPHPRAPRRCTTRPPRRDPPRSTVACNT